MATSRILNQGGNPFSAGAVILDSTPVTQYYLNQEAKKQAKEEALDKYYQDQVASISSKGLRDVDMNYFGQKYKELQNLYMQKKDAIKNPSKYGFEAAQEYNQRRQELMNLPAMSKQAQEEKMQALKISMNPANRDILDMKTFDESLKLHDLPIGDPRRKAVDLSNINWLPKRLTPQEKTAYMKGMISLAGKEGKFGDKGKDVGNYQIETPYTEEFSKETILKLAEKAKLDAVANPSLRRTAREELETLGQDEKDKLAITYQKYFGKPMINGEDLLAAQVIQTAEAAKESKQVRSSDYGAKSALSTANSFAKMAANQQGQGNFNPQNAIDLIYNSGTSTSLAYPVMEGKPRVYGKEVTLPSELEEDLYDKRRGNVVRPDVTLMSHDKSKLYLIYKNENGETNFGKTRVVDVPTSLAASLGKNYGGVTWTKKNLFNAPTQQPSNEKPTTTSTKGKVR